MNTVLIVLAAAYALDMLIGDPVYPYHPVRLIGHLISLTEKILTAAHLRNRFGGLLLLLICQAVVIGLFLTVYRLTSSYPLAAEYIFPAICAFLVYSSLTVRDLSKHGAKVRIALEAEDLDKSRGAVQMIIGRDAKRLDKFGVARAAVESIAESFVDGFLAPSFWFVIGCVIFSLINGPILIGGTIFILIYRITNTLDSMVGYKNEKYRTFGTVSAVIDDILNLLPARLSVFIITLASFFCRFDTVSAWKIGWRDRLKHSSPNAGHTEAVVSGALGLKLNGPGIYPHGVVDKPWLGDGTTELTGADIQKASNLIWVSAFITMAISLALVTVLSAG